MTAATDVRGSWFSSGYYGHYRSKSRNDFVCEYRQIAKPVPPKRFLNRARQPTAKHVFSHHDNRESFLDSALYFEQQYNAAIYGFTGLGRKRVPNETYNFKQDFITWMPEREFTERSRPLCSTYRVDFKVSGGKSNQIPVPIPIPVPQIIIKRPKTSFDGVPTSTYRYAHSEGGPNKPTIDASNNESVKLSLLNRKNRCMSAKPIRYRETVASCLNWVSSPRAPVKSATQTDGFMPHPPAPTSEGERQVTFHQEPTQTAPVRETTQVIADPPKLAWTAPVPTTVATCE
ncbi:uncharacterized protein LOC143067119 isoform X1 [Mytilus galloprovincialis]|uniref:uncharacterized protein LOC143067119 isoform X1 n=1 Tax=Mytilus galloprovincialis TaxID=29158 RepID=UPI003F7CCBF3